MRGRSSASRKASSSGSRISSPTSDNRVDGCNPHVIVIVGEELPDNRRDFRRHVPAHRPDQIRLVFGRREGAGGGNLFQRLHELRHEFFTRKNLGKSLNRPFHLMMCAEKTQDGIDGVLSFVHKHPHNHAFFFDILRDDLARNGKTLQKCIGCLRSSPIRKLLGGFDPRRIFTLRFRKPLDEFFDLPRRRRLPTFKKVEHVYLIQVYQSKWIHARALHTHSPVQMWSGNAAGRPGQADRLPIVHNIANLHINPGKMRVQRINS